MTSFLFFMLDHHVVLVLQVDPLDQGLHLVGQPLRTDCPPASEELHLNQDHPGVEPGLGVGQAHLQPVGVGDTLAVEREDLQGRDRVWKQSLFLIITTP